MPEDGKFEYRSLSQKLLPVEWNYAKFWLTVLERGYMYNFWNAFQILGFTFKNGSLKIRFYCGNRCRLWSENKLDFDPPPPPPWDQISCPIMPVLIIRFYLWKSCNNLISVGLSLFLYQTLACKSWIWLQILVSCFLVSCLLELVPPNVPASLYDRHFCRYLPIRYNGKFDILDKIVRNFENFQNLMEWFFVGDHSDNNSGELLNNPKGFVTSTS